MPSFFKNITIDDVGYVKLPVGDTSQRPSNTQNGQIRFNSDRGIPEFRDNAQAEWKRLNQPSQVVATGGDAVYDIEQFGKKYRVHVFTQDGTFSVSKGGEIEYLVVAGGGAGGVDRGNGGGTGGGGAGGYRSSVAGESSGNNSSSEPPLSLSTGSYTVTVGAGGASGDFNSGSDSSFHSVTSIGGGYGGGYQDPHVPGADGGSGGGGSYSSSGGSGTAGQGNDGGASSYNDPYHGAGGGGASQPGTSGSSSLGVGGDGIFSSITGISIARAGGGGGGANDGSTSSAGNGGIGGGGDGRDFNTPPQNGTPNTGGGGGGASNKDVLAGGSGGSGIVVARYEIRDEEQLTPADKDITEGLVLDLDFAKPTVYTGSGSTVSDSRLFPFEGTLINADVIDLRTQRAAANLPATDDYIELDSFGKAFNFGSKDFTFCLWLQYYSGNSQPDRILEKIGNGRVTLIYYGTQRIFFQGNNGSSWDDGLASTSQLNNNEWYFVVFTKTGDSGNIYIDGNLDVSGSGLHTDYNDVPGSFTIGSAGGSTNNWQGKISMLRIYEKFLTQDEVQNLYNLTRWRFGV